MKIAITGASGELARAVTELTSEQATDLVLLTRRPGSLASWAARGAEVRWASFDDAESLMHGLRGVSRLLMVSTDALHHRAEQHARAITAAAAQEVQLIIYTSFLGAAPANPAYVSDAHLRTEHMLAAAGPEWIILRNAEYAEFVVGSAELAIKTGALVHASGNGRSAFVSRLDCAAVAARLLTAPAASGTVLNLTGPDLLSRPDVAALVSEAAGCQIDARYVAPLALREHYMRNGLTEEAAHFITSFDVAEDAGYFEVLTDDVRRVIGREPKSLRDVLRENRSVLRGYARRERAR